MSSRFTKTRHTRKRPPVCHTVLRAGTPVQTEAHPFVLVGAAHWTDLPGTPPVSYGGLINLYETSPDAAWHGEITAGNQKLELDVTKTPFAPSCDVVLKVTAQGIPEQDEWYDVPCPRSMCNWTSQVYQRIISPGEDFHWWQITC